MDLVELVVLSENRLFKMFKVLHETACRDNFSHSLQDLLSSLNEDKHTHLELMVGLVEKTGKGLPHFASPILLDRGLHEDIEGIISRVESDAQRGDLTETEIVQLLIDLTLSEWNPLNNLVRSILDDDIRREQLKYDTQLTAAYIQTHLDKIVAYLRSVHGYQDYVKDYSKRSVVWHKRILLVDDQEPILKMLEKVFQNRYRTVDTAGDGKEALTLVTDRKYYDAILTDIDMPWMSGIEFYERAVATVQGIGRHFIFMSGELHEHSAFLREHSLPSFSKPFRISDVMDAVYRQTQNPLEQSTLHV